MRDSTDDPVHPPRSDPTERRPDAVGAITILAEGAVRGDRAALEDLAARLTPILLAQARHKLGGNSRLRHRLSAEDLVQDVWVRALPHLGNVAAEAGHYGNPFTRYLSSFMNNRLLSLMATMPPPTPASSIANPEDSQPLGFDLADDTTGVVPRACRHEASEVLSAKIDLLPDRDRVLLVARGIEQRSYAEISQDLGVPVANLRVQYARALVRLRGMLPPWMADEFADP